MATPPRQNDSTLTSGLDRTGEAEKSVGEIAPAQDKQAEQIQSNQAARERLAAAQQAKDTAEAAWEREQAEQEQEQELEQDGLER